MKTKKILAVSVLALLVFNVAIYPVLGIVHTNADEKRKLTFHLPISINGNGDFTSRNGVTGGSGTEEDPYIISNWKIRPIKRTGISISNTDAYFIVENCHIFGNRLNNPMGIWLLNVTNGKILNSACQKNSFGIIITSSSHNIVENCVSANCGRGLSINACPTEDAPSSSNNIIKKCEFYNCENGIYFCCIQKSSNNLFESCFISNNEVGVLFDHLTNYITFTGCNISNNNIGLKLHSTSCNNHFSNNVFWNNDVHAYDNLTNFWDNGPHYGGNVWSDHNASNPYTIPGLGNNVDRYPRKNLRDESLIALFTYHPRYPVVGEDVVFDASCSYDTNNIISYAWDFGDGTNATGRIVSHVYPEGNNYNVTLKISTESTNDTIVRNVNVSELIDHDVYVSEGTSIQDAIDDAKPGYNIYVDSGTYYENIIVNKPYINIIGSDYNDTIIDGGKNGDVIDIIAPFVNITGFTITNSSEGKAGIQVGIPDFSVDSIGGCIKQNFITGNSKGINMNEIEQSTIVNNIITDNELCGISTDRSFSNIIKHNFISFNEVGISLYWGSNWNEITKNTITENSIGVVFDWSHYEKVNHNNIIDNDKGIRLSNALSPKINYNNIYDNVKYGLLSNRKISNANHNWWGSKLGPSLLLSIRGDKVIEMRENGLPKLRGGIKRLKACFPWETKPLEI